MDTLMITDNISLFSLFGWGFLAGALTSCLVMMVFDWIKSLKLGQVKS